MRTFVSGLVAAGLLFTHAAQAAQCARPVERTAFDITGLKSQLMVTALSCAAQDRYNAFVVRFRPNLLAQDRTLNSYFGRAYGRRAQAQHDEYVTSLANQQSEEGTKLGTTFCQRSVVLFDEVMALAKPTDLPTYVSGKTIAQPIALENCPAVRATTRRGSGTATTASKKKKALRS